jgi:hypothetical protein
MAVTRMIRLLRNVPKSVLKIATSAVHLASGRPPDIARRTGFDEVGLICINKSASRKHRDCFPLTGNPEVIEWSIGSAPEKCASTCFHSRYVANSRYLLAEAASCT